jgi:hypothetical protein
MFFAVPNRFRLPEVCVSVASGARVPVLTVADVVTPFTVYATVIGVVAKSIGKKLLLRMLEEITSVPSTHKTSV